MTQDTINTHLFRPRKLPAHAVRDVARRFSERGHAHYREWSAVRKHERTIADAIGAHCIGQLNVDASLETSLATLYGRALPRMKTLHQPDVSYDRQHTFDLHPGLNVLAPPYDANVKVKLGSNMPSVRASATTGEFGVVATAMSGPTSYSTTDTYGAAGVALVIVPSHRGRTLTIRPYFVWDYDYACESHGSPTAHCRGSVSAAVNGHRNNGQVTEYPAKAIQLWTAGSDLWDDASGAASGVFRNPDAELVVSGHDYYVVTYGCSAGADSARVRIGWWSAAFVRLNCRVPFIAIRET